MYILYIIGASQAFFLFILSLINKKSKANCMLSILLLAFALHLLFFCFSNIFNQFASISIIRSVFPLLYGPSLYLYIQFQTHDHPKLNVNHYLHFVPFIFSFVSIVVAIFLNKNISINNNESTLYTWGRMIVISSFAFYGIASFQSLKKHKQQVFQKLSYTENVDLKWVSLLLQSLVFVWGIIVIIVFINKISHFIDIETERAIIYCVICVYVFFIGYNGLKQSAIVSVFKENEALQTKPTRDEQVKDNEQVYFDKIKQLVEQEKLYLNPKLSIKDIAERLKTNVNYVSRAINNKADNNFFEFINQYRVREFERVVILPEKANYTLLAIAMECGFNSKASFNRIVKETTRLTPIELKNKLLHNLRP